MVGNLNFNGNKGINLAEPTSNADAATKKYVDDEIGKLGDLAVLDTIPLSLVTNAGTMAAAATGDYVPSTRTVTVGGVTGTMSSNLTFTVSGGISESDGTNIARVVVGESDRTPYAITPASGTATVSRANGKYQTVTLSGATTISLVNSATNVTSWIQLDLWAGTNSVTFLTNNVTYFATPTPSTTSATVLIYNSPFKLTSWDGTQVRP
jgi:hypothetical protein